nr:MAG: wsv244-like protein [Penaeus semisulcatus pemonivirus]
MGQRSRWIGWGGEGRKCFGYIMSHSSVANISQSAMAAKETPKKIQANSPPADYVASLRRRHIPARPKLKTALSESRNSQKNMDNLWKSLKMLSCNGMTPNMISLGLKKAILAGDLEKAMWFARELHISIKVRPVALYKSSIMQLWALLFGIISPRDVFCVAYAGDCIQSYSLDINHIKELCQAITYLTSGWKSLELGILVQSAYCQSSKHHIVACEVTKHFSFQDHVQKMWECLDLRNFWWSAFHASRCLETNCKAPYKFYPIKHRARDGDENCAWFWTTVRERILGQLSSSSDDHVDAVHSNIDFRRSIFKRLAIQQKEGLDLSSVVYEKGLCAVGILVYLYSIEHSSEENEDGTPPQFMDEDTCLDIFDSKCDKSFEWSRDHIKDEYTPLNMMQYIETSNIEHRDTYSIVPPFIFDQGCTEVLSYITKEPALSSSASGESHTPSGAIPKRQREPKNHPDKRKDFTEKASLVLTGVDSPDCSKEHVKISESSTLIDSSCQWKSSSSVCTGDACKHPCTRSETTPVPELNKCEQLSVSMAPKKSFLKRSFYYNQPASMSDNEREGSSSVVLTDMYASCEPVVKRRVSSEKLLFLTDIVSRDETAYYNSRGKKNRSVVYRRVSDGTLRIFRKMTDQEATVKYFAETLKKFNTFKGLNLNIPRGGYDIATSWVDINDMEGCLEETFKPFTVFESGCVYHENIGDPISLDTPLETRLSKLPSHRKHITCSLDGQLQLLHILTFRLILGLPIPSYSDVIIDTETYDLYSTGETRISLTDPTITIDKIMSSELYNDISSVIKQENLPNWIRMDCESTQVAKTISDIQSVAKICALPNKMLLNIIENLQKVPIIMKEIETYVPQ